MTLLFWLFLALAIVVVMLSLTGIYNGPLLHRLARGARGRHSRRARRTAPARDSRIVPAPTDAIGLGIVIGVAIADRASAGDMVRVIALYGCLVVAVSALATLGPLRRALRIQPIDPLRAE
jgi:hypothetical protein